MYKLTELVDENKLPCFIRKKPIIVDSTNTTISTNNDKKSPNKNDIEKSLFDSLDLLNEDYLETYGIEDLNTSRAELISKSFDTSSPTSDNDIVYLCKIFTTNCAFARKYESKNVEEYLNNKYGSNTSIDISNDNIINNSVYDLTNIKYDDYIIPSNYEGLLEVLPDYSKQIYDSLDHETDVISFASRLKQPQNYYLAKPLQLFEIVSLNQQNNKTFASKYDEIEENYDDLIRKWVTFDAGTICLATKVLMVVYPPEHKLEKSMYEKVKDSLLCQCSKRNKIKFEVAIEFKIVKDFEELINTVYNDRKKSMHIFNIDLKQIEKLRNDNNSNNNAANNIDDEKYFYLPIYHDPNESIDLIPIASTNSLQLNSLQNIFNLMNYNQDDDFVLDNPMRVRIRVENSFNRLQNLSNITSFSSSSSQSFYEIYSRKTARFVVGYNIKREHFVLYALDSDSKDSKYKFEIVEQNLIEKVYDKENLNKLLNNKLSGLLEEFLRQFQYNIHKIELEHVKSSKHTSLSQEMDDDGYVSCKNTKIKNQFIMHWRKGDNQYTTFPKIKTVKAKKLLMNGYSNSCFNHQNYDIIDSNNNDVENNNNESNQRMRSKSLPDSDILSEKASFSNMSLIIEQDETKKSKI